MSQDTHLFQALVLQLSQAAWAALGKVPNPFTGKIERNLEAARVSIDTLAAIESSALSGNLDEAEAKMLQRVAARSPAELPRRGEEAGRAGCRNGCRAQAGEMCY